jgi:death on curing protein
VSEPIWLRKDIVLALHRRLLAEHGGAEGIRDEGLLESALARPRQHHAYGQPDVVALAAGYGVALIRNHAFVDGNKRIATMATILFLDVNGWDFMAAEPEVASMFESLAAGSMEEAVFLAWLRANARLRN